MTQLKRGIVSLKSCKNEHVGGEPTTTTIRQIIEDTGLWCHMAYNIIIAELNTENCVPDGHYKC